MRDIESDHLWMSKALALAKKGQGRVEPNPMVGAIIVRDGKIVGEGYHQQFGGPHAEVHALAQAGEQARGATLYVTLEPCSHVGKTPACCDTIVRAGVTEVVAAMIDPFPQVAGQGMELLKQAGIGVRVGILHDEAERLNRPYLKLLRTGKPYVIAKWAMTIDGKVVDGQGRSQWISGDVSRTLVHALRGRMDGILVGIGTVLADNPQLTARPAGARTAARIVLDSQLRTPPTSKLVATAHQVPTWLFHASEAANKVSIFKQTGCHCISVARGEQSLDVDQLLSELGQRQVTNLLVEGGPQVLGSFFAAQAVDEVWVFLAPQWFGSIGGYGPLATQRHFGPVFAGFLNETSIEQLGSDVIIRGICSYNQ